jgi:haloalkane dehalogenase
MHYVDEGDGPPILLLHGWPLWSYCYRDIIRDLSPRYRCIAPDMIGFGLSDKPEDFSYTPAAHCRNLTSLVEALRLNELTLVAHDFGGPVALTMALDMPEKVRRICLMNTWMWDLQDDPAMGKTAKSANGPLGSMTFLTMNAPAKAIRCMIADKARLTEDTCHAYAGPFLKAEDRHGAFAVAKQMGDAGGWYAELWRNRDRFLETPMQMIWGMKDTTFGEKALNRIWHEFPLSDVVRLDGAGHALMEDNPRAVAHAIDGFMLQVKPSLVA